MLKTQAKVKEFLDAMDVPLHNKDRPGLSGIDFDLLRSLVKEEAEECDKAMEYLDACRCFTHGPETTNLIEEWAEVIDAVCDLIYHLNNVSNMMGIDLEPFFEEVHRANMEKAGGPRRKDGKVLKPPGWRPPHLIPILLDQLKK